MGLEQFLQYGGLVGTLVILVVIVVRLSRLLKRGDLDGLTERLTGVEARQRDVIQQTSNELTRIIAETNSQLQQVLLEKAIKGQADVQGHLSASSEKMMANLQSALAAGRGEQQKSLAATTTSLETKFEQLRGIHEAKVTQLSQAVSDALGKSRAELTTGLQTATQNLETKFGVLRTTLETTLREIRGEIEKKLGESVDHNLKNFASVADKLQKLGEATGQIVSLSKGVNELNVLLNTPQARGAFGELTLNQMLADVFGEYTEMFETQFVIEDRERVDAAIYVGPDRKQVICIDSKFPLANAKPLINGQASPEQVKQLENAFRSDVLDRAKEIRTKYIKPPRTMDFAFMFVPAESVFYLLLKNRQLHEELLRMRVVPTSPNSLYAYLQALSYAYRGLKIQQKTQELQKAIGSVARDFERFANDYRKVGHHLSNAASKYQDTEKDVERFTQTIDRLKSAQIMPERDSDEADASNDAEGGGQKALES